MATVLLANLAPLVQRGLSQVLSEAGATSVASERRIVAQARRVRPDMVVLGVGRGSERTLAARIVDALPETKVILWPRDEDRMEVLARGRAARLEPARPDTLLEELGCRPT